MNLDAKNLPDDASQLKEIITSLVTDHRKSEERINYLEEYVRLLKNELFGRKSEKHPLPDSKQCLLFNEVEIDVEDKVEEEEPVKNGGHSRAKRGRRPLPADLPRIDIIHDIDESEKICPCGGQRKVCGEEVSEKLDYKPAELKVERHIRLKYACPDCEGVEDEEGPTVKIAPVPVQLLPKSIATAGLVAQIITSKFEDALPFYRQTKIFDRLGIDIPRATMSRWMVQIADRAQPLLNLLIQEIRSGPYANIDETPVQVLNEPGRANTTKSYMWVFIGGAPGTPSVVYQYHPTRSGQVAVDFLNGFRGKVQSDAFSGYERLGRSSDIVLLGCWVHARRMFDKVIKAQGSKKKQGSAQEALDFIGKLYAVEKQARQHNLQPDQIRDLRQNNAKPVLDEFKVWLEQKQSLTPPKGLLGKAINYTLQNWKRLIRYIDDGNLKPDNNVAENAIRPFVVGRKNWLFSGHPNGADASASLYSLIETAKANGLKPYAYLRYMLDRLPHAESEADYKRLLPQYIDPAVLESVS